MMEKGLLLQNRAHRQKRKRIRKINTTYLEGTSPEPKETQSMNNVNERDKNRVIWRFAKFPQHLLLCISVLGGVFGNSSNLYCWGEGFALKDLLRLIIRGEALSAYHARGSWICLLAIIGTFLWDIQPHF
jgi:hypothetical protein